MSVLAFSFVFRSRTQCSGIPELCETSWISRMARVFLNVDESVQDDVQMRRESDAEHEVVCVPRGDEDGCSHR